MSTHTYTRVRAISRVVVDDVMCTYDHYPRPSTLELYDSDPRIDLDGLLSLVDLFGCFLLASPSTHTYSC